MFGANEGSTVGVGNAVQEYDNQIVAAVKALNGEEVTPDYVDTGVSILDKEAVQ